MSFVSSSVANRFGARSPNDVSDLAAGHPLAWVCSAGPEGLMATPLPLLLERSPDGQLLCVEGHFARINPQVAALRANPNALVLWLGVQGYVSPSWMADRTQAPSWNYASAQCRVNVQFDESDGAIVRHLRALSDVHEAGRARRWSIDEMGSRLDQLARRVIAFRAEVVTLQQRYKLGQDERDDVLADILAGLTDGGRMQLVDWMRRFNPDRVPAATHLDLAKAGVQVPPT